MQPETPGDLPVVTVVITTHNRSTLVRQAIESVLAIPRDTFGLDLVVVDDGSTDDTPAVLEEYPCRVVRTSGLGIVGARNSGLHAARGDFVQLLDDDDVFTERAVVSQLEEFARHPEYGAVHARAQITLNDLTPFGEPVPRGEKDSGWVFDDLLTYWPQIGTVLTRREVVTQLGGFHAAYEGDDEWDFFLRTAREWRVGRIRDVVMLFRQRERQAEERQQWRRTHNGPNIVRTNIQHLPLRERARIRLRFVRMRGWHAAQFVDYARTNAVNGEWIRAARSLGYALWWSPPHALLNVVRRLRA